VARESAAQVAVSIVYGFSVILLFLASASYHALKQNENEISIWRKLDHSAIFFMIAGTYTPVCF
jgi:hemolysin III